MSIRHWCIKGGIVLPRKEENGFTMVEILVAITILGIVVIPLMGLFVDALIMHAQREWQTRAVFLAQLRLEEVKSKIITAPDFAAADYNKPTGAAGDFPPPDTSFRYIIIQNDDPDHPNDMKNITARVWYEEDGDDMPSGSEQQAELNTKVARRR